MRLLDHALGRDGTLLFLFFTIESSSIVFVVDDHVLFILRRKDTS